MDEGRVPYKYILSQIYRTRIPTDDKVQAGSVKVEGENQPRLLTANDCLEIGTELGSPMLLKCHEKPPFAFVIKIGIAHVRYHAAGP